MANLKTGITLGPCSAEKKAKLSLSNRGRSSRPVLIEAYIPSIRAAKGLLTSKAVAEVLRVGEHTIKDVWRGATWKHVPEVTHGG